MARLWGRTEILPIDQNLGINFPVPIVQVGTCFRLKGSSKQGYPYVNYFSKCWAAHRLSYCLNVEEIPRCPVGGKSALTGLVLHHCDHKWCVNPSHLYLGTKRQNQQDMGKRNEAFKALMKDRMLGNKLMVGRTVPSTVREKIKNSLKERPKNISEDGKRRVSEAVAASNRRRATEKRSIRSG